MSCILLCLLYFTVMAEYLRMHFLKKCGNLTKKYGVNETYNETCGLRPYRHCDKYIRVGKIDTVSKYSILIKHLTHL